MNNPGSVTQLLGQLQSSDSRARNEAAAAIWKGYCHVLLDLACQNLDERLRRRVGVEDVVQSAFKSFFLRQQRGQYQLTDRNDLLRLLVRMTLNKVRGTATRETRRRRDYRREQAAPAGDAAWEDDDGWLLDRAKEGVPTPEEATALAEEVEERLAQLPADLRQIALWKLEGYTNAEIAALPKVKCSVRSVERKLRLIRDVWGVAD